MNHKAVAKIADPRIAAVLKAVRECDDAALKSALDAYIQERFSCECTLRRVLRCGSVLRAEVEAFVNGEDHVFGFSLDLEGL